MKKHEIFDGLAAVAALIIILGVGSAAKSAFADSANFNLNSGIPASQNR